jgi:hypothetical protein
LKPKDIQGLAIERRSLISNFLLCRALSSVISNVDKTKFPPELGSKIEDMIFDQLKNADP